MSSVLADYGLIWRHAVAPKHAAQDTSGAYAPLFAVGGGMLAYHAGGGELAPRQTLLLVSSLAVILGAAVLARSGRGRGQAGHAGQCQAGAAPARARDAAGRRVLDLSFTLIDHAGRWAHAFGHPALWAAAAATWLLGAAMSRVGLHYGMLLMFMPLPVMLLPHAASPGPAGIRGNPGRHRGLRAVDRPGGVVWQARAVPARRPSFRPAHRCRKGRAAGRRARLLRSNRRCEPVRGMPGPRQPRAAPAPASLMLHAFGPGAHWSVSAKMLALMAAVLVAGRVLLELTRRRTARMLVPLSAVSLSLPLLLTFAIGPAANRRPRRRDARASRPCCAWRRWYRAWTHYNRELASALLRRALIEWAIVTVALVAVTVAVRRALRHIAAAVCGLLPGHAADDRRLARLCPRAALRRVATSIWRPFTWSSRRAPPYFAMLRTSVVPVAVVSICRHWRDRVAGGITAAHDDRRAGGVSSRAPGAVTNALAAPMPQLSGRSELGDADGDRVRRRLLVRHAHRRRLGGGEHDPHALERLRAKGACRRRA